MDRGDGSPGIQPGARSVIDPIRMENTAAAAATMRGRFLLIGSRFLSPSSPLPRRFTNLGMELASKKLDSRDRYSSRFPTLRLALLP